jgi:N-acyl-D-aspartate/D-glutamate deacylase
VTSRAEEYKPHARQCLEVAPTLQDEGARATLIGQAWAWLRLAHLAQANRQIAELAVQVARQRAIVKYALDTGQRSEMAVSLLDALEGSLRIFEKHRIFLLSCSGSSSAPSPSDAVTGRSLSRHNGRGAS